MRKSDYLRTQLANEAFAIPVEAYHGLEMVLQHLCIPADYVLSQDHKLYVEDIYNKDVFDKDISEKQDGCDARYSNVLDNGQLNFANDFRKAIEFWNLRLAGGIDPETGRLMTIGDMTRYFEPFMNACIPYDKLPYNDNDTVYAPRAYLKKLRGKYVRNGERVYCQWYDSTKKAAMLLYTKARVWCLANQYIMFFDGSKKAQKGKASVHDFLDYIKELNDTTNGNDLFQVKVDDIPQRKCYFYDYYGKKVECIPYKTSKIRRRQQYVVCDEEYVPDMSHGMRMTLMMLPLTVLYVALWIVLVKLVGLDPGGVIMTMYMLMPLYLVLDAINPWGHKVL